MHSFNSLLWNLAPASPIMLRLEPHLQRQQQQRQSSVGCTHWLPGPVFLWPVYTTPSSLHRVSEGPRFTFHSSPNIWQSFPLLGLSSQERENALFHDSGMWMQSWTFQELSVGRLQGASDCLVLLEGEKEGHKLGAALVQAFNMEQPANKIVSTTDSRHEKCSINLKISS